jgi:hypothetical protein
VAALPVIQMADSVGQVVVRARAIDHGEAVTSGELHNRRCTGMSLVSCRRRSRSFRNCLARLFAENENKNHLDNKLHGAEKIIVAQLVKKFPALYGIRKSITVSTRKGYAKNRS